MRKGPPKPRAVFKAQIVGGWEIRKMLFEGRIIHASARKGRMRVHRSGDSEYTAYLVKPIKRVGVFPDLLTAQGECEAAL